MVISARSLAAVVTVGRGVAANNGGGGDDNIGSAAAVWSLNMSQSPPPRWVVTQMPIGHRTHFKAD